MILAGDIGGTNTRIALVEATADELKIVAEETYPSRERPSLEAAIAEFLSLHSGNIERASFGIAGPVRNGRCEATNLPWGVDSKSLAKRLHLKSVGLINDLEANAYGIAVLQSKDFVILNKGARNEKGNRAIISVLHAMLLSRWEIERLGDPVQGGATAESSGQEGIMGQIVGTVGR